MDHSAVNNFLSLSIWCTGLNIHYIFIQVQCTCLYHFKTVTIPTQNFASLGKTNIFLILIKIQLYFKHSTSRKYTSIIWKSSKMCSTLCMKYIWIFFVVFYVMTKTYNFNLYIIKWSYKFKVHLWTNFSFINCSTKMDTLFSSYNIIIDIQEMKYMY